MRSGVIPSVLEIIDKNTLIAINQNTDLQLPEAAAILLAEADGFTKEETDAQLEQVISIFNENGAADVQMASGPKEAEALWLARKSAGGVLFRINIALEVEDLAVPLSKVAETLKFISELSEKYRVRIPAVGHAGDGNLHPAISYDPGDPDEVNRVHMAAEELLKKVTELGGTLTGEHGIGLAKAPFMHLEHDAVSMEVMRRLKTCFDPNNILNPGKMAL
jgi:glycolate oxidase